MTSGKRTVMMKTDEQFYRVTFKIDEVRSSFALSKPFTHEKTVWQCYVRRDNSNVNIALTSDKTIDNSVTVTAHIINGSRVHLHDVGSQRFGTQLNFLGLIQWPQLLKEFCTDDEFMIEIAFPTPTIPRLTADPLALNAPMKLENAIFTDVQVAGKDSEEMIDCNRNIICMASTAMLGAFSNPTSKESMEKKFTIGHDCATVENTHLLVKCMYEGWNEKMDDHAAELYLLADCYGCDRIAVMAKDSIERNLTKNTFWKTAGIAVLFQKQHPNLLEACAKFANQLPNGVFEVLKLSERGTKDTIVGVVDAITDLHK